MAGRLSDPALTACPIETPFVPERWSARRGLLSWAVLRSCALPALLVIGLALRAAPAAPQDVAFTDVSLVPLDADRVLAHQTVVVHGDRIAAIGPVAVVPVPSSALRIDGRGKYLMSGLADMHVHLFDSRDLLLYLANGITTIRNLGGYGSADSILDIRRQIAAGERLGPTVYTSGNWLDGDPPFRKINTVLRTPAEARAEVRREKRAGYDFVKVYATLQPEVYREILRTAREEGIPVTGHVPGPVGIDGVIGSGQVAVDHAAQLATGGDPTALAKRVHESDMSVTTTLVMLRIATLLRGAPERLDSMLARPEARLLSSATRRFWREAPFVGQPRNGGFSALYGTTQALVRALEAEGVPLLLGTDAGLWGNVPGYSAVEEVRLLVASGLTPYQALRAATVAPARFLNRHVPGAEQPEGIRLGDRADLVLLDGDPLRDVALLKRNAGVMVRGQWLTRERLDGMLRELASDYAREQP